LIQHSLFAGIDIGSSFTKVVLIDSQKEIQGSSICYSGISLGDSAKKALHLALPARTNLSDIKLAVATGYGRKNVQIQSLNLSIITEISCSAKAAHFIYPNKALTIIDIGGQDTKFVKIRDGKRIGFKMNRKCAAGTGTFLEELALKLRIQPSDLNDLAAKSINPQKISSYCTVFAGTEILTRIREGAKAEDMIRGAFVSVINRVLEVDTLDSDVLLIGGVIAHNPILLDIFKEITDTNTNVPSSPQLFVALGASLYALNEKNHANHA
jgi:predicted CoA-substrate-specific enzyme activase